MPKPGGLTKQQHLDDAYADLELALGRRFPELEKVINNTKNTEAQREFWKLVRAVKRECAMSTHT